MVYTVTKTDWEFHWEWEGEWGSFVWKHPTTVRMFPSLFQAREHVNTDDRDDIVRTDFKIEADGKVIEEGTHGNVDNCVWINPG